MVSPLFPGTVPVGTPGAANPLFPGQTTVPMPQPGVQPSAPRPQPQGSPFLNPGGVGQRPMPGATYPSPSDTQQPLIEEPPQPNEIVDEDAMGQAQFQGQKPAKPLDQFRAGLPGIISALGYGLTTGNLADGAQMLNELGKERRALAAQAKKANATVQWLRSPKINREDLAQLVENDPSMAKEAVALAGRSQTDQYPADVQEYLYAKSQGYKGSYQDWKKDPAGGGSKDSEIFGVIPQFIVGPNGEKQLVQIGNKGTLKRQDMPEGYEPYDPGMKAGDVESNKLRAAIRVKLPSLAMSTKFAIQHVDEALKDPGLADAVGFIAGRLPAATPQGQAYLARLDQIHGEAFLQARQQLKGAGQVTDYEGGKAEQAYLRAIRSTNEADHIAALQEYKEHIRLMLYYAEIEANGGDVSGEIDAIVNGGGGDQPRTIQLEDGSSVTIRRK